VTAAQIAERLAKDGYVVLDDLVERSLLDDIHQDVDQHATHAGRNDFEGYRTRRVYALLDKVPAEAALVEHPQIMELLDQLLQPGFLLSANLAINISPGESVQPWHHDDAFYRLDRPRRPVSWSVIWALDDFTAANGGTELIRASHLWPQGRRPVSETPVSVEMAAGSAVVFSGLLWHRGGANTTNGSRMAITVQYCEPWGRQQENMMLAVNRNHVRGFSERIRGLLGYSIHPPFMGHVNGLHPRRLLDADPPGAPSSDSDS